METSIAVASKLRADSAPPDSSLIAAQFPLPNAAVAAYLVDLLLPLNADRPTDDEAA